MDYATEITRSLRDTMMSMSEITSLIIDRIYWEDVEDTVDLPYIVIAHLMGGYENETQANAVDSYWKICFYTADKEIALQAKAAMAGLHRKEMVVTNTPNVFPYSTIREQAPIYERDVAQNVPVYEVGGIYRVRVIMNEIC